VLTKATTGGNVSKEIKPPTNHTNQMPMTPKLHPLQGEISAQRKKKLLDPTFTNATIIVGSRSAAEVH
jgi:hypothetical protein